MCIHWLSFNRYLFLSFQCCFSLFESIENRRCLSNLNENLICMICPILLRLFLVFINMFQKPTCKLIKLVETGAYFDNFVFKFFDFIFVQVKPLTNKLFRFFIFILSLINKIQSFIDVFSNFIRFPSIFNNTHIFINGRIVRNLLVGFSLLISFDFSYVYAFVVHT